MKTNFLRKSENEERIGMLFNDSLVKIRMERRLPKIVELAVEASPAFQSKEIRERIGFAVNVLDEMTDPELLYRAMFWSKSEREQRFGCKWELPVRVAYGIVSDLEAGRDVWNPSSEDIRKSAVFAHTVREYIPEEMVAERDKLFKPERWIEELIEHHQADLAPERKTIELMGTEEAIANLHPIAQQYRKAVISTPGALDFYETFSELLKTYNSKEEWEKDSLEQRWEKVPEYLYIGPRGRVDLDQMMTVVFAS